MATEKTLPTFTLDCYICDRVDFSNKTKLRNHIKNIHNVCISSGRTGRTPSNKAVSVTSLKVQQYYSCPSCALFFESIKEVGEHVLIHVLVENTDKSNEKEGFEQVAELNEVDETTPITVPAIAVTLFPQPAVEIKEKITRSYEEAMLYACQQLHESNENKRRSVSILEAMNLRPFSIVNKDGREHNALASPIVIEKVVKDDTTSVIKKIVSKKRVYSELEENSGICSSCSIPSESYHLQSLVPFTPYPKLFNYRKYIELSSELSTMMNNDWNFYSNMKFVVAQLLAGSIIRNTMNGETIMINTVEVYGRTKSVDIHREPFGTKKQTAIETSLPPPIKTKYEDVWPTTLNSQHGEKLIIGTQACNALVTSSIRLDVLRRPTVGGVTTNFQLTRVEQSLASTIYLDEESIEKAKILTKNLETVSVTNNNLLDQVRQLNTRFDAPSTYFMCRTSGPITRSHQCTPYSMFTLGNYDRGRNPATKLFTVIGTNVLKDGEKAVLDKTMVEECMIGNSNEKIQNILQDIKSLFIKENSLVILGNQLLNHQLEKLAILFHPYIATANSSVEDAILQTFEYFKD